jgi:GcrA cell cycle regulator
MGPNIGHSWTDERVEMLKTLWVDGLSASQIAFKLGGITRSSVIGKVHRLGLSGLTKSPAAGRPRIRRPRIERERAIRIHDRRVFGAPIVEQVTLVEAALLELTETTCRWPVGDPSGEFFFCGGASDNLNRRPYCPYHSRVAYQPASGRRDDRRREAA